MIIKGKARGRSRQLARHLLDTSENESVALVETRGVVSADVEGALEEMSAQAKRGRSEKSLYHASISPEPGQPMNKARITEAVRVLEERLGLTSQPRIVVVHRKKDREHIHVVWSRIDAAGKVISDSWNYAAHEAAARELEQRFGHAQVRGVHSGPRAGRKRSAGEYELRQEQRSGISRDRLRQELQAMWGATGGGGAFKDAIEARGYRLVRGDRRGFVVLDAAGEAHALSRVLNMRQGVLAIWMMDVDLGSLPDVGAGRRAIRSGPLKALAGVSLRMRTGKAGRSCWKAFRSRAGFRVNPELAALLAMFDQQIAAVLIHESRGERLARIRRLQDEKAAAVHALKNRRADRKVAGRLIERSFRSAAEAIVGPSCISYGKRLLRARPDQLH